MPNPTQKHLQDFECHDRKIRTASQIEQMLYWDERVCMPPGGAEQRGEQTAFIKTLIHELSTDQKFFDTLLELESRSGELSPRQNAAVKNQLRKLRRQKKLPVALIQETAQVTVGSYAKWQEAKKKKDFSIFQPWLERVVKLGVDRGECLAEQGQNCYDGLLSEYELEIPHAFYEKTFSELKKGVAPLLNEVLSKQKTEKHERRSFALPIENQKQQAHWILGKLGFDLRQGRLDTSTHPFFTGMVADIRLTTRYDESSWIYSFYPALHECGHGLYEQGIARFMDYVPLQDSTGHAMHESQSRFWENQIGRSRAFCEFLVKHGPREGHTGFGLSAENIFAEVNRVEPTLIRVEADELTYNLHILVRYDLEQGLFRGDIKAGDLAELFKEKMKSYLGVAPPTDDLGVLQDIHWSVGYFGYFPSYTLGNLIASQLLEKIRSEMNVDDLAVRGEFAPILSWLNRNIHAHGSQFSTLDLVTRATGTTLSAQPLLNYIRGKYL